MKFRRRKWKLALSVLMLAVLTGCGVENEAATETGTSVSQTESSRADGEESVQGSDSPEESTPKTEAELLMEIQDPEERYEEARKLIDSRRDNVKENLEENLQILQIICECKSDVEFLSEQELEEEKKRMLEKVGNYHGKSAIVYLVEQWELEPRYAVFDDKDRLVYINNDQTFDYHNAYAVFEPNYYTEAYQYAQDLYLQYDEEGRVASVTANLLDSYERVNAREVEDRWEYDDQGNLVRLYYGDVLKAQFEYNQDGACIKKQVRRFERVKGEEWDETESRQWRVYEYQYRKDGYLNKSTEKYYAYFDGKNVKDVDDYEEDSMIRVESQLHNPTLQDHLGKALYGKEGLNDCFLKNCYEYFWGTRGGLGASVVEVDYAKKQEEEAAEDAEEEITEILPLYYCEKDSVYKKDHVYMIGVVRDCGDGFLEYIQYELIYKTNGELFRVESGGHALYYLPGMF